MHAQIWYQNWQWRELRWRVDGWAHRLFVCPRAGHRYKFSSHNVCVACGHHR